ncbi:hypothetical protein RB9941 [Rhodopirellula baltica SH 1]|uniref:Uncharacterized protein n=1 Tax=Rhodopirellula baltica (strain DSM 10527 / NCIMB 13988 / SH1) TaxID=243090 RepID=Q7UKU2_RHOBA|nr:hypothetical protein RB9941 [Rhodopirellula baltica SH 1]
MPEGRPPSPFQRSCRFISPSPRFARPSQGEADEKRLATQHFKTARPLQLAGVVGGVATGEIVRSSEGR